MTQNTPSVYQHGSAWVRTDFHLHTRKDKEFSYSGADDWYIASYIAALKEARVRVGVITNHNKFDIDEFRTLRKNARKDEILLLPGVELSVKDGSHAIVTSAVQAKRNGLFNGTHRLIERGMPPEVRCQAALTQLEVVSGLPGGIGDADLAMPPPIP